MALVTKKKKVPSTPITRTSKAPVSMTSGTKLISQAAPSAPTATATKQKAPVKKKPSVPVTTEPPKEVKKHVPPKKEQPPVEREERKSPEAPKPPAASERPSAPAKSRPAPAGAERVTAEAMRAMSLEDRYKLFRSLNRNPEVFTPIRRELPKMMSLRKDEAILRNIIPSAVPKVKSLRVGYCCYCVDWQVFHTHSWTGYDKCIGCGITTKDFYIAIDNGVFGKE